MSPLRRLLRVLLAVVALLAFSGGARAEYFCFGMQRTLSRCCCASVAHERAPEPEPRVERAPCCERRVKGAPAPAVRLDGSANVVPKAPIAQITLEPFPVRSAPPSPFASHRPVATGPRAGPSVALHAQTCRYLI